MNADVHALAGAYALNALPPDEQAFFERHLAECDTCRLEVTELQETASRLAAGVAATPPDSLRARVLAAADVTRQLPPEPSGERSPAQVVELPTSRWKRLRQGALVGVAACLALVVFALSGVIVSLNQRLNQARNEPSSVVSVLGAPDLETVDLEVGGAATPSRFLYSPKLDRGVLVANGLPEPGTDETYELWLIHDGTPVPAGLFRPGQGGGAIAEVSAPVRGAELVAVTIEPAGGSQKPTGEILASAPLQS